MGAVADSNRFVPNLPRRPGWIDGAARGRGLCKPRRAHGRGQNPCRSARGVFAILGRE